MIGRPPLLARALGMAIGVAVVTLLVSADARAQACHGYCMLPDYCATGDHPTGSRCIIERETFMCLEIPDCNVDMTYHPLLDTGPERELVTPSGTVRLAWVEGNRFAAWRSCDGRLAYLAEEQPDGRLRLLDPAEYGERYSYVEWLARRLEGPRVAD